MLTFPQEYFYDEVRDGFYVPGLMKCAWAAELKVLDTLKDLFRRHGLRYFADFGTLLGAVRHRGFIPWDDDIDIAMPRADYMAFLACADELPPPYRILSIYTSDTFRQFHGVASNCRDKKLRWDEARLEEFYGCPFIVNLDIYPLDLVPDNEEEARYQKLLYTFAYRLAHAWASVEDRAAKGQEVSDSELSGLQTDMIHLTEYLSHYQGGRITIDFDRPLSNEFFRVADRIAMSCPPANGHQVDYFAHMAYLGQPMLRETLWYREAVSLPFETTEISAPAVWSAVLEKRFGQDYMNPRREAAAHGYPFYRKQVEYLKFLGYLKDLPN